MYDYSTAHNQTLMINSINNLNDSVNSLSTDIALGFGSLIILLCIFLTYYFIKHILK